MTSTHIRPRLGGRVRPGLLATVVVAIVLGIIGMHGVDAHGVNLHGSMTRADAANPAAAVMADHGPVPVAVDSSDARSAGQPALGAPGHPAGHTDGTGSMVMMCVAMLAGAALTLLTLLVRRGRLLRMWAILDPAGRVQSAVPVVMRVGTGPPAVWRYSVIRC